MTKLRLTALESRDTPSVVAFDTGTVHEFPDGVAVVAAGFGGGPRVDVYRDGEPIVAFFAFEDTFRGGVNVDYADGTLLVGAGPGGGPVEVAYDVALAGVTEVSRRFRDDLLPIDSRFGWVPNVPPVIPFTQHPTHPLTDPWILDSYARDLNRVPRELQQRFLDAGLRIVVHSAPHLAVLPDGRLIHTFYTPAESTIYIGYGGGMVHEVGHAHDWLVRGSPDAGSEAYANAFETAIYFGGGNTRS